MNQLVIDEFRAIYQNNQTQKLLPYLQKLTAKERKELVKELRLHKDVAHQKGNKGIYFATAIACCTQSQFRSYTEWFYISGIIAEQADEILAWYCPDWFSEHYNNDTMWGTIAYPDLLRWQLKGFLKPSRSLIARSISQEARKYNKEISEYEYPTDFLYADPLVLEDHIWALFEETSSIQYHDTANPRIEGPWTKIFKTNIASGHLERMRVLRACLLTVNHSIDKINMGWCFDLFAQLKPTQEELLALQEELRGTFVCEHTKPVNKSLDALKQIADHPDFCVEEFLSHLTLLLSSETKSIVQSTLMILQKVAKKQPSFNEVICKEIPLAFLNKDEAVQTRAAKIIVDFGIPTSEAIRAAVASYRDVLLMSTQALLKDYLEQEEPATAQAMEEPAEEFPPFDLYAEENRVQYIETVEDLVFFLSALFDREDPLHLDLLPEALVRLTPQITAAHLSQLQIALEKAYSLNVGDPFWHNYDWNTKEFTGTSFWGISGLYLRMLALFFINYGQYLQKKYPQEGQFIKEMHQQALQDVDKQTYKKWFTLTLKISPLAQWFGRDFKLLQPYLQIFSKALSLIEKGVVLPLLSTPTHAPVWIDPQVLNERLEKYKKANVTPDPEDWQLALSRCPSLLEKEPVYNALQEHIRTYSWKIEEERKADSTYSLKPVLAMQIPDSHWQSPNLYAGIGDNIRYYVAPQDAPYLAMMYPTLPAIPYGLLIRDRFHFAQMENAETRDMLTVAIAALYELKTALDPVTSLFLSCCMLCSEKTIRNYAAEIWMERTTHQLLQQAQLGQSLGFLMSSEWAPVKRFTDMVTGTFLTMGTLYSRALETLFVSILLQIQQPVTNLKKLLELYCELLALNRSKPATELLPKLQAWEEEKTLKKVIKQLKQN